MFKSAPAVSFQSGPCGRIFHRVRNRSIRDRALTHGHGLRISPVIRHREPSLGALVIAGYLANFGFSERKHGVSRRNRRPRRLCAALASPWLPFAARVGVRADMDAALADGGVAIPKVEPTKHGGYYVEAGLGTPTTTRQAGLIQWLPGVALSKF